MILEAAYLILYMAQLSGGASSPKDASLWGCHYATAVLNQLVMLELTALRNI